MSAHDDAMNWLRGQGYSSGQINDAIGKVSQQQSSGMSRSDIMSNIRSDTSSYFGGAPMYGSSSGGGEGERKKTYEELHPARTTNMGGKDFSLQTHADGSVTVSTGGKNQTINAKDNKNLYDTIMNHYNGLTSKQTNTNPNMTGNESGIGDQAAQTKDKNKWENFDNSYDYYLNELGLSPEEAFKKASAWVERDTISTSKEEKEAELQGSKKDDETIDNDTLHVDEVPTDEVSPTTTQEDKNNDVLNGAADKDTYTAEEVNQILEEVLGNTASSAEEWANKFISNSDTKSNVVTNKAEVSKDPIFDYNTYFKENLAPEPNVGETGKVKAKPYDDSIKDVKTYQDEAISSLESLGFLEPNTEAAVTMPNTEEQTAPEIAETPESLVQGFDNELTELGSSTGLAPQAVAQTYVNYKNKLTKYIKDNNISDEEAAAMYDQLKNNEKFRDLLTQTNK